MRRGRRELPARRSASSSAVDDGGASDELNRVSGIELGRGRAARRRRSPAGRRSPPMASNAMRAKATLPWLRPAARRRSTRTRRQTWCGRFIAWHRGHFWIAIAGAVLWVLRARFFRFEVRRFGTAMGDQRMVSGVGSVRDAPRRGERSGAWIGFRRTGAGPALRSAPHAGTALDSRPGTTRSRGGEQPLLPDGGSQVDVLRVRSNAIDVGIVGHLIVRARRR